MSDKKPATAESWLPAPVQVWVDRIANFWERMPIAPKLFAGAMLATALAVAGYFAIAPMVADRTVLFSGLDGEDAAQIVEQLKAQQIPYELTGDGTTIEVPKDRVHELRLQLASAGLPRGGQVGFESFEKLRLGATEFEQQVTYRRAMEGELARTIATVKAIKSARVHLVLPKKSVFAQKEEPATASIVVKLAGGMLEQGEVMGIVHLVASAVSGLQPDRITLVTTDGVVLHRPKPAATAGGEDEMSDAEADQLAQSRVLESALEERTRTMLERVLGPGHVDVRVSAELDLAKIEQKSDLYDPQKTALRSEQQLIEQAAGSPEGAALDTVAGVPGAEANLPGGEGAIDEEGGELAAGRTVRRQHTRNFEINRIQERRVSVTQSVKRLAVAVVVDGVRSQTAGAEEVVPRTRAELDKLGQLVRSAVGYDEGRGDEVTVESVPFYLEAEPDDKGEPTIVPVPDKYRDTVDKWMPLARYAGMGVAGLIGFFVARRLWRRLVKAVGNERARSAERAEKRAIAAQLGEAVRVAERRGAVEADYRAEALHRAKEDPATAALVMRHWLGAETRVLEQAERAA